MSAPPVTLVPGRYASPIAPHRVFELEAGLDGDLRWHLVYRSGHVSTVVVAPRGVLRADVTAIERDPAAAAVRAGRCPCCQVPAGRDHRPEDCRCASPACLGLDLTHGGHH